MKEKTLKISWNSVDEALDSLTKVLPEFGVKLEILDDEIRLTEVQKKCTNICCDEFFGSE